jgi:asparagine synthase (glutamine-hydrolysing)
MPVAARSLLGKTLRSVPVRDWDVVLGPLAHLFNQNQIGRKVHRVGARLTASNNFRTFYQSFLTEWKDEKSDILLRGEAVNGSAMHRTGMLEDFAAEMMALDTLTYLPDDILVKVDRASMAYSLETRAPFLDHRVIELAWKLPTPLKIGRVGGKEILKDVLSRHVPRTLFERPKMGFSIPLDDWLRGPLKDWAGSLLSSNRLKQQGFLDSYVVHSAWQEHLKGAPLGHRLWSVLMFQAWLDAQ